MWPAEIKHPILKKWLNGTTCYHYNVMREVVAENEEYIILKHGSHAAYINRFSGNSTCVSYARLFKKEDLLKEFSHNDTMGDHPIKEWVGRISLKKVFQDCEDLGVKFSDEEKIVEQ